MERAGLSVRDIHGDLDQAQRTAAPAFKRGEIAYLVATDVAARGLDIAMLPCVINYDVPTTPTTTCIASGAPAAPARRGARSSWCCRTSDATSTRSRG